MSLASITPEPMSKVQIVVPQSYGSAVINSLYTLNLFHVKHYKSRELAGLDNGAPLSYAEELSKTLITLRAAALVIACVTAVALQKETKKPSLTALDYAEIQQLAARYTHGDEGGAGGEVEEGKAGPFAGGASVPVEGDPGGGRGLVVADSEHGEPPFQRVSVITTLSVVY